MTDDVTKLRELAEAINGIRPMPFASADLCRRVANEMELANARIDSLLDSLQKAQTALAEFTAEIDRLRAIAVRAWHSYRSMLPYPGCRQGLWKEDIEELVKLAEAAESGGTP